MSTKTPNIKHVIAIASGKGGVGKSTTAMNLAVALSISGQKVGLMDADVYGPSQPRMMGLTDPEKHPQSADGKIIQPAMNHGVKCMSMGFMVAEDEPIVWRGPMLQKALVQMLFQVEWGELDVLVVDMPPGTGDAQISMASQADLSGAIIVSTPQDVALIDARKGLNMFKKVNVPILGIVENMSTFCCPNCNHESHIFGEGGAAAVAEELDLPLLGEVPLDLDIRQNSDVGKPIVLSLPDSKQAGIYRAMAAKVVEQLEQRAAAVPEGVKVVIEDVAESA